MAIGTQWSEAAPLLVGGAAVFIGGQGDPGQDLTFIQEVSSNEAGFAEVELVLDPSLFTLGGNYYVQWIWTNPPGCPTGNQYSASEVLQFRALPIPGVSTYGFSSPWSGGSPSLRANDIPKVGNSELGLLISRVPPSAAVWVVIASAPDMLGTPLPLGVTAFVDLGSGLYISPFTSDAFGKGFQPTPVSSTAIAGSVAYAQAFSVNPSGEALLSATDGLQLVVQP
jgi:hypothetical protein